MTKDNDDLSAFKSIVLYIGLPAGSDSKGRLQAGDLGSVPGLNIPLRRA